MPINLLQWDQFIFVVEVLICLLGIYLNRLGLSKFGRLFFLITWPLLLHVIPIWHQHTPTDYFFAFPVGIIFHAVLIQLMFSHQHERWHFWILIVINFLMLLFSIDLMLLFAENTDNSIIEMVKEKVYLLDGILYWLLFSSVTFFLIRSIENLIEKIKNDQRIIEDQREELAAMNEELTQTNESLLELNNQISLWNETLEETVAKRTSEIERQNIQLKEYAFYNAHKLRGPFCRIKGLLNLNDLTHEASEKQYIHSLVSKTLVEFDDVVKEIQGIVNDRPNIV